MRESIGGTMLFWIVFITFMASIIKYARVYKVKNNVINYIERMEGVDSSSEVAGKLSEYGYNYDYVLCRYNPSDFGGYYYLKVYAVFEVPIVGWKFDLPITGETRTIMTGEKVKSDNFQSTNGC